MKNEKLREQGKMVCKTINALSSVFCSYLCGNKAVGEEEEELMWSYVNCGRPQYKLKLLEDISAADIKWCFKSTEEGLVDIL